MSQSLELRPESAAATEIDLPSMFEKAMALGPEGVQMLKELVVLRREMDAERAAREYAGAMLAARAEMPEVTKDSRGENSKYAKLEKLDRLAYPIYSRHGFSLEWSEAECHTPNWTRLSCTIQHVAGHKEVKFIQGPMDDRGPKGAPNKTGIQGMGSTWSYLQRRLLAMIFNIRIVGEDNDGNKERTTTGPGEAKPKGQTAAATPLEPKVASNPAEGAKRALWAALERVASLPSDKTQAVKAAEKWLWGQNICKGVPLADMDMLQLAEAKEKVDIWLSINKP